jgi:hypothetical protein
MTAFAVMSVPCDELLERWPTPPSHPEHLTRLTKEIGPPRNKLQQEQDKGRESRQRVLDYFADMMTSPDCPIDADQMRELTATWLYFPEGRKLAEKIDAVYGDIPDFTQRSVARRNHRADKSAACLSGRR